MSKKNSLRPFFSLLICVTLMLLFYVHIQAEIFRVSYSIEKKDRELAELSEKYKISRYSVTQLKSPNYLNEQLKKNSMELIVPKDTEILKIPVPKSIPVAVETVSGAPVKSQLLSLSGLVKEAQAKTSSVR